MLQRRLAGVGAVLVEGPKWCGKTTTAAKHAKTVLYLDNPSELQQNMRMAEVNPGALLAGIAAAERAKAAAMNTFFFIPLDAFS